MTERLTRLKDCRHGRMLFLRTDRFIGPSLEAYGEYCHGETELFEQILKPGQVAVEVGANIGAHTVRLSQLVGPSGRVVAFEPQRVIFQILCANIALNDCFNTHTYQAGSGARTATLKVPPVDYAREGVNFGGVSLDRGDVGEDVPIIPLDTLDLPSLRLLKIDVEGMELEVLEGARAQIARHRPILYVENDRHAKSPALIGLIQQMGYDLWWHLPKLFNPANAAGNKENIFGDLMSLNVVCLPKEEASDVTGFHKVAGPDDWPLG